jgi:hypothetical protein
MEKNPKDRVDLQNEIGNKKALIMYPPPVAYEHGPILVVAFPLHFQERVPIRISQAFFLVWGICVNVESRKFM